MNTHRNRIFLTLAAALLLAAHLCLAAGSTHAAVLLGGFDGDNAANAPLQDASVAGSITVTLTGFSAGNFGDGSGLWGTTDLDPDPSTATGANTSTNVRQAATYDLDLTVTNNSAFDLTLDQIHIVLRRDNANSLTSGDVIYVSGDLDDTDNTTILTQALVTTNVTGWDGYDMSLASLTDDTLGAGEFATIRWSLQGTVGANDWIRADNFAISGEFVFVPEPGSLTLFSVLGVATLLGFGWRRRASRR